MSYDLFIASEKPADLLSLRPRLSGLHGVRKVEGNDDQLAVTVAISSNLDGVFFIASALRAEPEDIDDCFFEYVRSPQWLIEITVPASADTVGVEIARQAAIIIARAAAGAVFDPQEDGVYWPSRKLLLRGPHSPRSERREISIVSLTWIVALPNDPSRRPATAEQFCEQYLQTISSALPDGAPVRCGGSEPMQGRGAIGFKRECQWAAEREYGGSFSFSAKAPCVGGNVHFSYPRHSLESPKHSLSCVEVALDVDASSLRDAGDVDRLATAFVEIADALNAIYAAAHYLRGYELMRGQLWTRKGTESAPQLLRSGWIGVPPSPAWIIWLHNTYLADLPNWPAPNVAVGSRNGSGFILGAHPCPLERATLAMPEIPADLRFRPGEETVTGHNPGAQPAPRIPPYTSFVPRS